MKKRPTRDAFALLSLLLLGWRCCVTPVAAADGRFLGKEDIVLYGVGLKAEPAQQTVPKDIATIVSVTLRTPTLPENLPPFAPGSEVRATLRGPSFTEDRHLTTRPNTPFEIPPLTLAGPHTLENIRLVEMVSDGAGGLRENVLLRGAPESVNIEVIEKLLVTQVTARPLTAAEIREKGITFDASNFQAYNFTAAFAVEDRKIDIQFPVVLPRLESPADAVLDQVGVPRIEPPALTTIKTIIPDTLRIQTQVPNLSVTGFTLNIEGLEGQQLIVPPIPGVVIIPGDIGFLNQYFSVMLMVGNVAPGGSGLLVKELKADILLPLGKDGVANSLDDPLRMARTAAGESSRSRPVTRPGPDGTPGTADDVDALAPGESGNAEYLVEGRREGGHVVEMEIQGMLHGLPVGPVRVRGRAAGAVLVRNPKFTLTFTHPEVVNAGEPYTLDVTVTNTSESPANFVSLNLSPRQVSGATILGEPVRQIEYIAPGDSEIVSFDLMARVTGKVTAATLDSDENVAGRFSLKTAVGELGVPLSPDSLVLPKEAAALPRSVRDAALALLGKAYAVATAPAAALPKDVRRFSKKIVWDRAIETAEAGFRISLHEPTPDSAAQLYMDFLGSQYARLPRFFPRADDHVFEAAGYEGFDALRRRSVRGEAFTRAVAGELSPVLAASAAASFHANLARKWGYRPSFVSAMVSASSGPVGGLSLMDDNGRRAGPDADGVLRRDLPFADWMPFPTSGAVMATLAVATGPLTVDLLPASDGAPQTLSLVAPSPSGSFVQYVFADVTAPLRVVLSPSGDGYAAPAGASATLPVPDDAPSVLGAVQQANADRIKCDPDSAGIPGARVVAVLFSEEVTPAAVQHGLTPGLVTRFTVEENDVRSVSLQPGRRIAFVALRDPFGPFVPRALTVSEVEDLGGRAMASQTLPMEATVDARAGLVSGRVLYADGSPVPFGEVRLYYRLYDCGDIGISAKRADAEGRYTWDYVSNLITDKIIAFDAVTDEFRAVPFNIQRDGQRLNIDIVLLGRGSIKGVVRDEDGAPLPNTSLRFRSLTDHSEYGARTNPEGAYSVDRVPVGNVFIEAVNPVVQAEASASEYIPFAGASVERDLVLISKLQPKVVVGTGTVSGHVLSSAGDAAVPDVPVVAYYKDDSQPGVRCPGDPPARECAVALVNTDAAGAFRFESITAGELRLHVVDQPNLREGEGHVLLAVQGARDVNLRLNGGLASVRGVVLAPDGTRVAGARVGGGLSLSTADEAGEFLLTDVPVGAREIVAVSDAWATSGRAMVDVLRPGETVNVTVVLEGRSSLAGVVTRADGVTPVPEVSVHVFRPIGDGKIEVVASTRTAVNGSYRMDRLPLGTFKVSAFLPDFSDGQLKEVVFRQHGQFVRGDLRFRGGGGRVSGTVLDDDGVTPLRARVGVSSDRVVTAGGQIGIQFQRIENFKIMDTDFTTGRYAFTGLFTGTFTVQAAGQFSPDPVTLEGLIPAPNADVRMDLRLQPTSQVAGTLLLPDGVTPAGPDILVRYKSEAFKLICTEFEGIVQCDSIPQGIQEENVVTDDDGRFWFPIVNAGAFTLLGGDLDEIGDRRVGRAAGNVRAGEKAEVSLRLMGRGEVEVRVRGSNGVTPIPGAQVTVEQLEYPKKKIEALADAEGRILFSGADGFSEGDLVVEALDLRNGFKGRAAGRLTQDGEHLIVDAYIFDAVGSVEGVVTRPDRLTPVPNAEVVVGNREGPLAYAVSDSSGSYRVDFIPLGDVHVEVFEAATGRRGYNEGSIDLAGQVVPLNVSEYAVGRVQGHVMETGPMTPLKGWSVGLSQTSPAGRPLPYLQGSTGVDGGFTFPGASQGTFTLSTHHSYIRGASGSASVQGRIDREGEVVDVPLLVDIDRPVYGRVEGTVRGPDGRPVADAQVKVCYAPRCIDPDAPDSNPLELTTDAQGNYAADDVPLGRFIVAAQVTGLQDRARRHVSMDFENQTVRADLIMSGTGQVTGVVRTPDGTPAAFASIELTGNPSSGCGQGGPYAVCHAFAGADGRFSFVDVPARTFTVTASSAVGGLSGGAGGTLNPGEVKDIRVVLAPGNLLSARVLLARGDPAPGVAAELILNEGNRDTEARLYTETGPDGRLSFRGVPVADFRLLLEDTAGTGLSRRSGRVTFSQDLGDIVLDESAPLVAGMAPAPSSLNVPLASVVRLTFTEPILPGTVTPERFVLSDDTGPVAGTFAVTDNDTLVTFTPLAPLKDETRYSLRVRDVHDRLDKPMPAPFTASFLTVDITPPRRFSASPLPGTGGAPIYTPIRVPYSEPIVPSRFSVPFSLLSSTGGPVPGNLEFVQGNTALVFTPLRPLVEDALYRVIVGAAEDLSGNREASGLDYTFTTTDRTPPVVLSLTDARGGTVIEGTSASLAADVGVSHDVAFVDFLINDVLMAVDRVPPFTFSFLCVPDLGFPGDLVKVSAVAVDTSGNRGTAPVDRLLTILRDLPPTASVSAPLEGAAFRNGERVLVRVQASDDVGVSRIAYRVSTGRPQDAGSRVIAAPVLDRTEDFFFHVPDDAAPGALLTVEASAVDTKGQSVAASTVSFTVLDAVPPSVSITGAASGQRVFPGQTATALVIAGDLGKIRSITFRTSGITVSSQTRTLDPASGSVVTSFSFPIPSSARPGETVFLDAVAEDLAGNTASAARVILPVADTVAPTVSVATAGGRTTIVRGRAADIVVSADDEIAVQRLELTARGAFSFSDARQVSPPLGSAQRSFSLPVPEGAVPGDILRLEARAVDLAGNVSTPALLDLTIATQVEVFLPPSLIVIAGESVEAVAELSQPAPPEGTRLDIVSDRPTVALPTPSIFFPAGASSATIRIEGVSGGSASIEAFQQDVSRARTTVIVRGGVVRGTVFDAALNPVPGVQVTARGSWYETPEVAETDEEGRYFVEGLMGPTVSVEVRQSSTGLRGYAAGSMNRSNGYAVLNPILIPAGLIRGVVRTPAGSTVTVAGLRVDIYDAEDRGFRTPLETVFTDETGAYFFPLVTLGRYHVEASDLSGNKGRAEGQITRSGEELFLPVTYLGRGSVRGVVRNGAGNPVPTTVVTLKNTTIFGWETPVVMPVEPDGSYRFDAVRVGAVSIEARDVATNQGATVSADLQSDGQILVRDLSLASYASLRGVVRRADGVTPVAGAAMTVTVGGTTSRTVADEEGRYLYAVLPLGSFTLYAREDATNGVGKSTGALSVHGSEVLSDVRFYGQGTLVVTVTDAGGAPVPGARLNLTARLPDGSESDNLQSFAGPDARAIFERVLAGNYTLTATSHSLSGQATGPLFAGEVRSITVPLEPTASIIGAVFDTDGVTPASGTVRFIGSTVGTEADGRYRFDGLRLSTYTWNNLEAYDAQGRKRAVAFGPFYLNTPGQELVRNMTFAGLGNVAGRVLNPDGSSAGGVYVSLAIQHPQLATQRSAQTNAAGFYLFEDVPVGPVIASHQDSFRQLRGEAAGVLPAHGSTLTLDILLQSNVISLPVSRYDGTDASYDLRADGSIGGGELSLFGQGVSTLEIVSGTSTVSFPNASFGTHEESLREIAVRAENLHGLNVVRKTYVPKEGYFARHIETFSNPTGAPITATVRVRSRVPLGFASSGDTLVTDTSSGDAFLSAAAPSADRWALVGDVLDVDPRVTTNYPGLLVVFDGAGGADAVDDARFQELNPRLLTWEWRDVVVDPGQSATFIHFTAQQPDRDSSLAAAARLDLFPPEAFSGLEASELSSLRNFPVSPDSVPPLPATATRVSGRITEADGVTDVAGVTLRLRSLHPLYPRLRQYTGQPASYALTPPPFSSGHERPFIPAFPYEVTGVHPMTGALSPLLTGAFPAAETVSTLDISFTGTTQLSGRVRRHTGSVVTAGIVILSRTSPALSRSVSIAGDGAYAFAGLDPAAYTVTASVNHAQGSQNEGTASFVVPSGPPFVTTVDVSLAPTGGVRGTLRNAAGVAAANAAVTLRRTVSGSTSFYRSARTDTSGFYQLTDIPAGAYVFSAQDPLSSVEISTPVAVLADAETVQDITFAPTGSVLGRVTDPSGNPVANLYVSLQSTNASGTRYYSPRTDAQGRYRQDGVPTGSFQATTSDYSRGLFGEAYGVISFHGQEVTADIAMIDNAVNLPRYLYDANGFYYEVRPDGSMTNSLRSLFSPSGSDPRGASLLELISAGTPAPFTGASRGAVEDANREISVRQDGLAGLRVTRKVFTPQNGYFARYLEKMENLGADPVTVDLRVTTRLRSYYSSDDLLRPVGSSNGDAGPDLPPGNPDRWVAFDDTEQVDPFMDGNLPASAFVFDGEGGALAAAELSFTSATYSRALAPRWNGITIPPGGTAAVLHFLVQQVDTAGALSSARRLSALPPEALEGLSAAELSSVVNFNLAVSTPVPDLPALTGAVVGRLSAFDGATPVPDTDITFRSAHPLFGRSRRLNNLEDAYSFRSSFLVESEPFALPISSYVITAVNPEFSFSETFPGDFSVEFDGNISPAGDWSSSSRLSTSYMPTNAVDGNLNTEWRTASNDAANLGSSPWIEASFLADALVRQVRLRGSRSTATSIRRFLQMRLSLFDAAGVLLHEQVADLSGDFRDADIAVPDVVGVRRVRLTSLQDQSPSPSMAEIEIEGVLPGAGGLSRHEILFADTGVVRGTVRRADGVPTSRRGYISFRNDAAGISVSDEFEAGGDGTYLMALPPGAYVMSGYVYHPLGSSLDLPDSAVEVSSGATTDRDVLLPPSGALSGTVRRADGLPAAGLPLNLYGPSVNFSTWTASDGSYLFPDIPPALYTLRAREPNTNIESQATVTVVAGETASRDLTLVGYGSVDLSVLYTSGRAASGLTVQIRESARGSSFRSAGTTNSLGRLMIPSVSTGTFTVRVYPSAKQTLLRDTAGAMLVSGSTVPLSVSFPSVASLRMTVTDSAGTAVSGVAVTLRDATSTAFFSVGNTNSLGQILTTWVPEGNYQVRAIHTASGRTGFSMGTVRLEDDNLTLPVPLPIAVAPLGALRLANERDIWGIPVNAGDRVVVFLEGVAAEGMSALSQSQGRLDLHNPDYSVLATIQGTFSIPAILDVVSPSSGTLPLIVRGRDNFGVGGYRLSASVNGVLSHPVPYPGGFLAGTVFRHDGVTPSTGTRLNLTVSTGPMISANVVTDADGRYAISGVPYGPLGRFVLRALDADGFTALGGSSGTITAAGDTLTSDVRLLDPSALQGVITHASGRNVVFMDGVAGQRQVIGITGITLGAAPPLPAGLVALYRLDGTLIGSSFSTLTVTPNVDGPYYLISAGQSSSYTGAYRLIPSVDDLPRAPRPVVGGTVEGVVISGDGVTPLTSTRVRLTTAAGPQINVNVQTDGAGFYRFLNVPAGVSLGSFTVTAIDASGVVLASRNGVVSAVGDVVRADIALPIFGSALGRITTEDGTPRFAVSVSLLTTGQPTRTVPTDAGGNYLFSNISHGAAFTIRATHPGTGDVFSSTGVVSAPNEAVTRDFVLPVVARADVYTYAADFEEVYRNAGVYLSTAGAAGFTYMGQTNSGGYRQIRIPGGAYTLRITDPQGRYVLLEQDGVITLEDERTRPQIEILVPPFDRITGVIFAGDALTPAPGSRVELWPAAEPSSTPLETVSANLNGGYAFSLPRGFEVRLRAIYPVRGGISQDSPVLATSEADDSELVHDMVLPLGVVRGAVTYADGVTPVAAPSVTYLSLDGTESIPARMLLGNTYSLVGASTGSFILRAMDTSTGLTGDTPAALSSVETPLILDLHLPPSGTISGAVLWPDGAAAPGFRVQGSLPGRVFSTSTDKDGLYSFSGIPLGSTVALRASEYEGDIYADGEAFLSPEVPAVTHDITLPALASLRVTVRRADGSLWSGVRIEIRNSFSESFRQVGTTDGSGVLLVSAVPQGPFTLLARTPSWTLISSTAGVISASDHGFTREVSLQGSFQGTIQGVITTAASLPLPSAEVRLLDARGEQVSSVWTDTLGAYVMPGVAPAGDSFTVMALLQAGGVVTFAEAAGAFTADGQTVVLDLSLPVSVVRGRLLQNDGVTPSPYPSVFAFSSDAGSPEAYYSLSGGLDGSFYIAGLPLGDFTLQAQDGASGVVVVATGAVTDLSVPLTLDLLLPPLGTVRGTMEDASGAFIPNYGVSLRSPGLSYDRYAYANPLAFQFENVPAGPVTLQSCQYSGAGYLCASSDGLVPGGGLFSTVLRLPATGQVSGVVRAPDAAPSPYAYALVESLDDKGPAGRSYQSLVSGDDGFYLAPGLPAGRIRVTAIAQGGAGAAGMAEGVLSLADGLVLDVTLGNAFRHPWDLGGTDGFRYDVGCQGVEQGGRPGSGEGDGEGGDWNPVFYEQGRLLLDGRGLSECSPAAWAELGGRGLRRDVEPLGGLRVARRYYAPAAGGFLRVLDSFENPGTSTLTVRVGLRSSLYGGGEGGGAGTVVVPSSSTGHRYELIASGGLFLGAVYAGPGAPVGGTSALESSEWTQRWHLSVPPGRTVSLLHYLVQRDGEDGLAAQSAVQSVADFSAPDVLTGLTPEDRAGIANFILP